LFIYFFFFQAEDGIRDFHVTGVQTCALPILARPAALTCSGWARSHAIVRNGCSAAVSRRSVSSCAADGRATSNGWKPACARRKRSEERRVGKEGRARRGAYR